MALVVESVARSLGVDLPADPGRRTASPSGGAVQMAAATAVPVIWLRDDLYQYIKQNPSAREAEAGGIVRHELDQAIVAYLVNAGCSDGEIKAWFEAHRLSRYVDEKDRGRGDEYLARAITHARNGWPPSSGHTSQNNVCIEGDDPNPEQGEDRPYVRVQPRDVLEVVAANEGSIKTQMRKHVAETLGCSDATAKRRLNQVAQGNYVEFRRLDGRTDAVFITERGRGALEPLGPAATRPVWVEPMQVNKPKPRAATQPSDRPSPRPQKESKPVSEQTRINRAIRQLRDHQIGVYPRISWKGQNRVPSQSLGNL